MDATAAAADQQAVLVQLAGELRETVDALAAQVPGVQRRDLTGDSAAACFVGADDDGTQQWIYGVRLVYDADPEAVAKAARDLLTQRGFTLRENAGQTPLPVTALREGAAIAVRGAEQDGSRFIGFVGSSACVGPDGTVDRTDRQ